MLIVLNHKMALNVHEVKNYEKILRDYDVVVMPQIPYMGLFNNGAYHLGSQYLSLKEYTGGISIESLKGMNNEYVLVGHADHRLILKETSLDFIQKINILIKNKMTPIYCIGETEEENKRNKTLDVLTKQITSVFNNLDSNPKEVIIAYEPIWAIGTGKSASKEIAEDTIGFIRRTLRENFGDVAVDMRILYGGSVKPENVAMYMSEPDIDGALVGGASLAPESFHGLIEGMLK